MKKIILSIVLALSALLVFAGYLYVPQKRDAKTFPDFNESIGTISSTEIEPDNLSTNSEGKANLATNTKSVPQKSKEETMAYSVAKTTGLSYKCTFSEPSFFGSHEYFTAQVKGQDFLATPDTDILDGDNIGPSNQKPWSARIGNYGYYWIPNAIKNPEKYDPNVVGIWKISLKDFFGAVESQYGTDRYNEKMTPFFFFIAQIPNSAPCTEIDSAVITIPNIRFEDQTQKVLRSMQDGIENEIDSLKLFPFNFYVPSKRTYNFVFEKEISAENQGLSDPDRFNILFSSKDYDKHSKTWKYLRIEESKISKDRYDPPADCRAVDPFGPEIFGDDVPPESPPLPCDVYLTTPKGTKLFKVSGRGEDGFMFSKNTTLVFLSGNEYVFDTTNELSKFVDSFENITPADASRIFGY